MPKLTIELDSETHKILKENARKDERSLTQYIQRVLRQNAGTLVVNDTDLSTNQPLDTNKNDSNNTTISTVKRRTIGDEERRYDSKWDY